MTRYAIMFFLTLCALASAQDAGQGKVHTLRNVRWPDFDEHGNMVSELTGDIAVIREDGLIDITNLTIFLYKEGVVQTVIKTPRCLFDRENAVATSEHDVQVERQEIILSGTGFKWNAGTGRLEIYNQSRVVLVNMDFDRELERRE